MFPKLGRHKLDVVAKHLGVIIGNHHRALDDAKATAEIFSICIDNLKSNRIVSIDDIQRAFADQINYKKAIHIMLLFLLRIRQVLKSLQDSIRVPSQIYYKRPRIPKSILNQPRGAYCWECL